MEKQNFLPKAVEKKLKERIKSFSSANNTELEKLFQDVLVHFEELETQNQRLEATQNELSALKDRYTDLFDNAPVGYLTLDSSLKIQEINKAACANFSMKPEELTGKFFKDFVDDEYHKLFSSCFKEIDSDIFISKCDVKLKTTQSTFFARIIVSTNIAEENAGNFRMAVIDISKEKEIEDKLIEESGKARENERLKSAFMANMSHEIRTPMNGIVGFSELLQEPDLSPENLQSYSNIIQNSSKRMLSLINDLLAEMNGESSDENRLPKVNDPNDLIKYLTVLVAEDDEPARLYLAELLKNKCKKIHFAKNGHEAVEMYAELKPDMVLMDIKMPVMDGYSAAIKIKGMDENAVIVAQTAYALAGDREKALAAGCSDYLAKPVLKEDLIAMIRKHFM